ncbi:MAG: flagellar basal body-associated FliL family protein [Rhodanobacter sp.]
MVEEVNELVAPAAAPRKRKWLLLVVAAAVLLVGAGGGYFWFAKHSAHGQADAPKKAAAEVSKVELYLPLEPAFVVNFSDGDTPRYLQVGITLMAHDQKAIDTAKGADPVIRDAMVSLLSTQDAAVIGTPAGRKKLQAEALAAVQRVVKARLGQPGVEALYFTSFVIQ